MGHVLDAFLAGRGAAAPQGGPAETARTDFERGVEWARGVLLPAIERANGELGQHGVQFRLDTNFDPRSTNNAHVDFWLAPAGEDSAASPHGLRHSVIVERGVVMVYKHGAPGEELGPLAGIDTARCEALLARAAEEYGRQAR